MNSIQNWFDHMVGVVRYEQAQLKRAHEIFGAAQIDVEALERPACWRRPLRSVGRSQRVTRK